MDTVTHHGRATAFRRTGRDADGAPVLFVHGSGGTGGVWSAQLSRLSSDRPVIALDLSGHGDSDDADADAGWGALSAYADDVLAVAAETGARALVGNSLGGAVAMHIVLERDHEFDALALVGTGAKLAVLDDLLAWLRDDFDRAVEFLHGPDRLFHGADDRYVAESKRTMREVGREVTRRDFQSCHAFDVRDRLDEIDVPTLALAGEHDRLTPPYYHDYLAEEIPDAECVVLAGAAHLAMVEQPDAFNRELTDFLQ